jgi:hypothetical protein
MPIAQNCHGPDVLDVGADKGAIIPSIEKTATFVICAARSGTEFDGDLEGNEGMN